MKILMIGMAKVKYMPYLNFYLDNIPRENNEIHLVYWNRDLKEEDLSKYKDISFHEFKCYQEDDVSKTSKITSFIKYRRFVKKVLKTEKFDFVITMQSITGVLLLNILKKHFKGKYIFDYRDMTYEKFSFFKNAVNKLAEISSVTFISSEGFSRFFTEENKCKILNSHNILLDSLNHRIQTPPEKKDDKIRVIYWGLIRHKEINKRIISKISADDRFELHYYGREQQLALDLKEYTKEISAKNIFFHGEYNPEDRYEFTQKADLLHNIMTSDNAKFSMTNKYYDGLTFCVPQLAKKGAFMAKCITDAGIGIECDPNDDDFLETIYNYYSNLNYDEFINNCNKELDRVMQEYNQASQRIKDLLTDKTK